MKNYSFCLFTINNNYKKIVWEITNKCNMSCKHCCANAGQNKMKDIDLTIIKKVLDEMKKENVKEIYYSGGEPFIRKDFIKILDYTTKLGIKINIATNGTLITDEIATNLKRMNIQKIHISIDGHNKNIYSLVRGDFFNEAIRGVKLLKEKNLYVRIGCLVFKGNEDYIQEMINLCNEINADELIFNWPINVGRFKNNNYLKPTKEIEDFIKEIKQADYGKLKISMHRSIVNKESNLCPGGKNLFYISPKGFVSPCSWIHKIMKDFDSKDTILNKSFNELINSKEIIDFRRMIKKEFNKYNSKCPALSSNYFINSIKDDIRYD